MLPENWVCLLKGDEPKDTIKPKIRRRKDLLLVADEENTTWLSSCQRHVRPIFEMKWRPRAFSRVSTGDSDILSSCDMNDEHA